jgi:hypothetical protein
MLEVPDAPDFNEDDAVFEVLANAQMSEVEIAVSAGIPIAKTRAALAHLAKAGRVGWHDDDGLILWSRT